LNSTKGWNFVRRRDRLDVTSKMGTLPIKDIAIGIIGAVLGAVVVSLGAGTLRIAAKSRKAIKAKREAHRSLWHSGDTLKRVNVTLEYLFVVLSHFLVANLFWLIPDVVEAFTRTGMPGSTDERFFWPFALVFRLVSLIFFFLGIGRIVRYASVIREK